MHRLPLAFFTAAALLGLGGMLLGTVMGASGDFTQAPVHAHINLIGWASLAIMGTFYALAGGGGRLGWLNFGLMIAGITILLPALAISLANGHAPNIGLMIGPFVLLAGMLAFIASVLSRWRAAT